MIAFTALSIIFLNRDLSLLITANPKLFFISTIYLNNEHAILKLFAIEDLIGKALWIKFFWLLVDISM